MKSKIPVVVIVGTTACGKTDLAVNICKKYNGEAVSADSMQIYKYLDIGTAKPNKQQLSQVKHHMIDIIDPEEKFSVAQYCEQAHVIIADINNRGKLPVVVGGTGLYINSLINNIDFIELDIDLKVRQELQRRAKVEGLDALIEEISITDPKQAQFFMTEKNEKRIIRTLEIIYTTKKSFEEYLKETQRREQIYDPIFIGLTYRSKELLHKKINSRVDLMLNSGLLEETKYVMSLTDGATAKLAIGYKELFDYFKGNKTLEECVEDLKRASRKYAKRQLTWFKKNKAVKWIFLDDYIQTDNVVDFSKVCSYVDTLLESWQ